jgi:hypothetical protein
MLTSSMYEDNGSFASGVSSNHSNTNHHEETVDVTTFRQEDEAAVLDHVAHPPPYPPPAASTGSFPPPPVSIIETSTADWGMMVVDGNSNDQNNSNKNDTRVGGGGEGEDDDYELVQGGVLILEGVSSTGGEDHGEDPDASLSVPDSDNIPSDPGTIHGAAGGGGESGNHSRPTGNWEHLISDDEEGDEEDDEEGHGNGNASRGRGRLGRITLNDISSRVSSFVRSTGHAVIAPFHGATTAEDSSSEASTMAATSLPQFVRTSGLSLLVLALAVILIPGYSYYQMAQSARNYEARWIQLQEENARLQQQEEDLRKQMEILQEEAVSAMAMATSLYQEHEKWKVLNAAMGDDRNRGDEDFYFKSKTGGPEDGGDENFYFKSKTGGPGDNGDKHFSFDDACDKDSFTIFDNCLFKIKAKAQLGDCADGAKDYFKDLLRNFWSTSSGNYGSENTQDFYAENPYMSSSCSASDSEEDCREKEKEQNEYNFFGEEDPLHNVFSAVQSFGQSLSQLLRNDGFTLASLAISDAMAAAKKDIQALSLEALTMLDPTVLMNETASSKTKNDRTSHEEESPSKPESDTRKGFFDANIAWSSLSQTWKDALEYMVTASTPGKDE